MVWGLILSRLVPRAGSSLVTAREQLNWSSCSSRASSTWAGVHRLGQQLHLFRTVHLVSQAGQECLARNTDNPSNKFAPDPPAAPPDSRP